MVNSYIRKLRAYRRTSARIESELSDAVHGARNEGHEIVEIATEAGISRNRVYRILGRQPSKRYAPTEETE